MIELEMLGLIVLVGGCVLVGVYGWMNRSPKFEKLLKQLEPRKTEIEREAASRREVEERRKMIEAERKKKYNL